MRNATRTELYLGAQLGWVDLGSDPRQGAADSGGGTTITRTPGDAGTMDTVLANTAGRYSPRNPRSDLYGLLGRNTPIRFGLLEFAETFGTASAAGWGNDWTSFGAGGTVSVSDSNVAGGAGRHLVPVAGAYRVAYYDARAFRDCELRCTVDMLITDVTGGTIEPANLIFRLQDLSTYYMARVEVSATEVVTVSLHHSTAGTIAAAVTVAGLVFTGQPLKVAASCVGDRLAASVWDPATGGEPRDWQVTGVDTRLTAAGYPGIRSGVASANTNTKPLEFRYDDVQIIDRRAHMEVSEWPTRWNTRGTDVWVPVKAAGILRRLGQGAKPFDSALYRYLPTTGPSAYWPLEDPAGSTSARSAVDGVDALTTFGYSRFTAPGTGVAVAAANLPVFASGDAGPGSLPVVDLAKGGVLHGKLPYSPLANWRVEWVMRAPRDKGAAVVPIRWNTDGTWDTWDFQIEPTGIFATFGTGLTAAGSASASLNLFDGLPHHFRVDAFDNGSPRNTDARIYVDGVQVATYGLFTGPPVLGTSGSVTHITINPLEIKEDEAAADAMPILGHVAVWNPPGPATTTTTAMRAHVGEAAADRIERLCAEQGVPVFVTRGPDPSAAMGAQRAAKFLDLLRECEAADGGILGETREQLALAYRCLGALYNRSPVALDYTHLAPNLEPTDDDDTVRNDVEVKRPDGGTARAVLDTGPLSTQPPPAGVGVYDTSVAINVSADGQLPDQAGWRLHVGTWDEARYPTARVNLASPVWAAAVDLAALVVALADGDVVTLDGLPVWLPPGPALSMVRGTVERVDEFTRTLEWTWIPGGPYTVATADGERRVPADGTTLAVAVTAGGLSLQITSTVTNGSWTTAPADFPLLVRVGGEVVRVSGIAGAGLAQTATVSARGVNGAARAWPVGTVVDVAEPAVAPL